MTLISAYNSEGCIGRCDAKCYNAVTPVCECICGGRNHGAGRKQAIDNTRQYVDEWMDKYGKEHGITKADFTINGKVKQLELF